MSKELPYFRFYVSEWLNDDISLEDFLTKGVFADVCSFYWFRDCSITKAMLKKRFSNNEDQIEALINSKIIKTKNGSEFIEISFLDKQFDELSELRKRRQEAGRKGGKQGLSKPKAKPKQNESYKDKDKDNNMPFESFWNLYNKKVGDKKGCEKKWNKLPLSDQQKILNSLPGFLASIKDKQFLPYPGTYLNQQRWNDEIQHQESRAEKIMKEIAELNK